MTRVHDASNYEQKLQLLGSSPQWVFSHACKFLRFIFKAEKHDSPAVTKVKAVAVDTMFAMALSAF